MGPASGPRVPGAPAARFDKGRFPSLRFNEKAVALSPPPSLPLTSLPSKIALTDMREAPFDENDGPASQRAEKYIGAITGRDLMEWID